MRIILFTLEYPPFKGGVANYYGNMVKNWPKPDDIFVLDNSDNRLIKNWLFPKWLAAFWALHRAVKCHSEPQVKNPGESTANTGSFELRSLAMTKVKGDDKIHILAGHLLPLGTVAYYYSKFRKKIKYSVFVQGMAITYARKISRKKRMAKKILSRAENIICESNYTAGLVREFLGEKQAGKVHAVNPGISHNSELITDNLKNRVARLKEKYKLDNKVVLFSIGRLVKRKGFDKVIQAMAEVVKSCPNVHYFLAGDGPDKKYLYHLAQGVPNINFLGKITEEEKWTWLRACDIFIMPSRKIEDDYEGFGIVYLEANICGKPLIAGDSGGVRDAVQGAYSGILIDPENIEKIAGAIISLAQNPELRKSLGGQGRERALREFKWEDKAREIYNFVAHNS